MNQHRLIIVAKDRDEAEAISILLRGAHLACDPHTFQLMLRALHDTPRFVLVTTKALGSMGFNVPDGTIMLSNPEFPHDTQRQIAGRVYRPNMPPAARR